MTNVTKQSKTASRTRRRRMRAGGWVLVVLGVVVSWDWSVQLTILGASAQASVAGVVTMLLFCAGIVLIWRVSPLPRGRVRHRCDRAMRLARSAL